MQRVEGFWLTDWIRKAGFLRVFQATGQIQKRFADGSFAMRIAGSVGEALAVTATDEAAKQLLCHVDDRVGRFAKAREPHVHAMAAPAIAVIEPGPLVPGGDLGALRVDDASTGGIAQQEDTVAGLGLHRSPVFAAAALDPELWSGCVSGAFREGALLAELERRGPLREKLSTSVEIPNSRRSSSLNSGHSPNV